MVLRQWCFRIVGNEEKKWSLLEFMHELSKYIYSGMCIHGVHCYIYSAHHAINIGPFFSNSIDKPIVILLLEVSRPIDLIVSMPPLTINFFFFRRMDSQIEFSNIRFRKTRQVMRNWFDCEWTRSFLPLTFQEETTFTLIFVSCHVTQPWLDGIYSTHLNNKKYDRFFEVTEYQVQFLIVRWFLSQNFHRSWVETEKYLLKMKFHPGNFLVIFSWSWIKRACKRDIRYIFVDYKNLATKYDIQLYSDRA